MCFPSVITTFSVTTPNTFPRRYTTGRFKMSAKIKAEAPPRWKETGSQTNDTMASNEANAVTVRFSLILLFAQANGTKLHKKSVLFEETYTDSTEEDTEGVLRVRVGKMIINLIMFHPSILDLLIVKSQHDARAMPCSIELAHLGKAFLDKIKADQDVCNCIVDSTCKDVSKPGSGL